MNGINVTEWVVQNAAFPAPNPLGLWNVPPSVFPLAPGLRTRYLIHVSRGVS